MENFIGPVQPFNKETRQDEVAKDSRKIQIQNQQPIDSAQKEEPVPQLDLSEADRNRGLKGKSENKSNVSDISALKNSKV